MRPLRAWRLRGGALTSQRPGGASPAARKVGYLVGFVVDAVLLYLVNERPGRREVPFLTERMTDVLPLINLSLLAGAATNLLSVVLDAAWFRSLGQILVAAVCHAPFGGEGAWPRGAD